MTASTYSIALRRGLLVAASVACSVLLGGVFSVVATKGNGLGSMADFALLVGATAGFVSSPALIFALWRGPIIPALVWVSVPTTVAAYVGGVLAAKFNAPLEILIAMSVYLVACFSRGFWGMRHYRPPPYGTCRHCAYDLKGLASELVCPECGAPRTEEKKP